MPKRKGKTTIRATVIYKKMAAGKEYTDVLSYPLTILGKSGRELYCAGFCQTPEGRRVYTGKVVESISFKAFAQCKKMRSIVVKSTKLEDDMIGNHVFSQTGAKNGKKLTVEVPKSKKTAYTKYFRKAGLSKNAVIK